MIQLPYQGELTPAWTASEVTGEYKISKMTLNRWQNDGLPVIRLGRAVFFPVAAVRGWVLHNKINVPGGRRKYKYLGDSESFY
jgi:hypothetical protein